MLSGCKGGDESAAPAGGSTAAKSKADQGDFKDIVISDDENGAESKTSFGKDTAAIYCNTKLENVPSGSKVRGVWICEKSATVSEPNYKIAEKTLDIGPLINTAKFSLSKPTAGWPIGDYRVELYVGDKLKQTVKFKVA